MSNRVLFMYLRDPKKPRHVVTIARAKEGNKLTYSWAMNRQAGSPVIMNNNNGVLTVNLKKVKNVENDIFSKATGREIAEERLNSGHFRTVLLQEGDRPLQAILRDLANAGDDVPPTVRKLAQHELLKDFYSQAAVASL